MFIIKVSGLLSMGFIVICDILPLAPNENYSRHGWEEEKETAVYSANAHEHIGRSYIVL